MSALLLVLCVQADDPVATLRALGERMKDVRTMKTSFDQKRTTTLVQGPVLSAGVMYYRREPARLVFHLIEPYAAEIHMDREAYQVWRPKEKRLERIDFGDASVASRLFMVFDPKPDRLKDAFEISRVGDEIRLVPKDPEARKRMSLLALLVAPDPPTLRRIRYIDADGDEVRMDFHVVTLNPDVPADVWTLDVPPDAKVFRTKAR